MLTTKKTIIISLAAFLIPLYIAFGIARSYLSHVYYTGILAHSILLLFICSFLISIGYFYYRNYIRSKQFFLLPLTLFFWIIGIMFFIHSMSIPSFYFMSEYLFDITEHTGLLFAALALCAGSLPEGRITRFVHHNTAVTLAFFFLFVVWSSFFFLILESVSFIVARNIDGIIMASGIALFFGIVSVWRAWRKIAKEDISLPYLIVGLSMLLNAAIIPLLYKEWNIVWWYFHAIILIAEVVIFVGVMKKQLSRQYP